MARITGIAAVEGGLSSWLSVTGAWNEWLREIEPLAEGKIRALNRVPLTFHIEARIGGASISQAFGDRCSFC